jgi:hypothetical protein
MELFMKFPEEFMSHKKSKDDFVSPLLRDQMKGGNDLESPPPIEAVVRKVVEQNGTLYISIPAAFAAKLGIGAGCQVAMIMSQGMIRVVP